MMFVSTNMFNFSQYDSAFALLKLLSDLCDYNESYRYKIDILVKMAEVATRIREHEKANLLLKKAVEHAWFFQEQPLELLVYELMGYNYYMQGDIVKAKYYHNKYPSSNAGPPRALSRRRAVY